MILNRKPPQPATRLQARDVQFITLRQKKLLNQAEGSSIALHVALVKEPGAVQLVLCQQTVQRLGPAELGHGKLQPVRRRATLSTVGRVGRADNQNGDQAEETSATERQSESCPLVGSAGRHAPGRAPAQLSLQHISHDSSVLTNGTMI